MRLRDDDLRISIEARNEAASEAIAAAAPAIAARRSETENPRSVFITGLMVSLDSWPSQCQTACALRDSWWSTPDTPRGVS